MKEKKKVDENKTLSISIPESVIFALKKEALIESRRIGSHISVSSLVLKSLNKTFRNRRTEDE